MRPACSPACLPCRRPRCGSVQMRTRADREPNLPETVRELVKE
jgi:hypothetical protein